MAVVTHYRRFCGWLKEGRDGGREEGVEFVGPIQITLVLTFMGGWS